MACKDSELAGCYFVEQSESKSATSSNFDRRFPGVWVSKKEKRSRSRISKYGHAGDDGIRTKPALIENQDLSTRYFAIEEKIVSTL